MKKITLLFFMALLACSSKPAPKDVVFDFIDAVRDGDTTRVIQHLDIDAYLKENMREMSSADSVKVLRDSRNLPVERLFGEGEVRERWMNWQILVNREIKHDRAAEVEVSFINQMTRHQYYTQVQLEKQIDGAWKIIYFD